MLQPLRLGVVGCGHLLQKGLLRHLMCDDFRARARVVALCDAHPGRAAHVAAEHAVRDAYEDASAMLDSADLDAVLVLTPVQLHHEHALLALRAGKHAYVQKTMALRHGDAVEMVETAAAAGLTLAAAPGQMLSPAYQQMRALVEDGAIGRVAWAYAGTTTSNMRDTVDARGLDHTWEYHHGGGALWNTSVYSLHALTGVFGSVRAVGSMMATFAPSRLREGAPFDVTETDNALLLLEFESGALGFTWGARSAGGALLEWGAIGCYGASGSIEATSIHMESGWPETLEARGRDGAQTYTYPKAGFVADDEWETPLAPSPHVDIPEQHVYLDVLDFVDAIAEGRPPRADAVHAAHVVEVIEKTYRAADTGRRQAISSTMPER